MIRSDEQWLSLVDSFHAAALGESSWEVALQGLADATGSRTGQLTGIDSKASVMFNTLTNVDPAVPLFFAETATINPRVAAANGAPVLKVIADWDFITPDTYRRDRFCQEFLRPFDIPFVCLTTLERHKGTFIALAVVRSQREGHITGEQREIFGSIAPHVRAAVRTHIALEGRGVATLAGTMEALSIPVFLCDRRGHVRTLTQAAEALLASGRGLELKAGQLRASQPAAAKTLTDAIEAVAAGHLRPGPPLLRTVIIRGADDNATPIVLDVFPLPSEHRSFNGFGSAPRVLIVGRGAAASDGRRIAILNAAYGLTSAETDIALYLAKGKTAELIAKHRHVSVGTVRAQIKTILAKVGVKRQAELTARLNQL
jgi:DNA-binding CsgD family transcriptional regulator